MKRKLKNQNGASMVLALVVSLVIFCACASLFAAVSAMIRGAGNETAWQRARILALSVSDIVKDEFLHVEEKRILDAEENAVGFEYSYKTGYPEAGKETVYFQKSIPAFVYKNLGTSSWQWYNEGEAFRSKEAATRVFDFGEVKTAGGKVVGDVSVSVYWKSDGSNELKLIYTERELYVTATAVVNGQECSVTYRYNYSEDATVEGGYLWLTPVLVA